MTLRSIIFAATAGLGIGSVQADEIKTSGWLRATLTGENLNNPVLPEARINIEKGRWGIYAMPDIYRNAAQDLKLRAHTVEIGYNGERTDVKAGLLAPYTLTLSGDEFVGGVPSGGYSAPMHVKPGILGASVSHDIHKDKDSSVMLQAIGGTRLNDVNRFGAPDSPGTDAEIYGAGIQFNQKFEGNASLKTGYNYAVYGTSPTGKELQEHYVYALAQTKLGKTDLRLIAEAAQIETCVNAANCKTRIAHMAFVQAVQPLTAHLSLRVAAGEITDDAVIEALALYKNGKLALQAGPVYNAGTGDTTATLGFRLAY